MINSQITNHICSFLSWTRNYVGKSMLFTRNLILVFVLKLFSNRVFWENVFLTTKINTSSVLRCRGETNRNFFLWLERGQDQVCIRSVSKVGSAEWCPEMFQEQANSSVSHTMEASDKIFNLKIFWRQGRLSPPFFHVTSRITYNGKYYVLFLTILAFMLIAIV